MSNSQRVAIITDLLRSRLTREYGLQHPFVGAGMAFIAHEQLAAAVSNAGGLGVLGASPDPAESLPVMVERARALTSGPIGVDLICADTGFGPASTDEHIDACVQLGVPLVVFHHDPPPSRWVDALHAGSGRVWMQASSKEIAEAAVDMGVDGIVAQGSEAGGHARGRDRLHDLLAAIRREWPDMLVLLGDQVVQPVPGERHSTVVVLLRSCHGGASTPCCSPCWPSDMVRRSSCSCCSR